MLPSGLDQDTSRLVTSPENLDRHKIGGWGESVNGLLGESNNGCENDDSDWVLEFGRASGNWYLSGAGCRLADHLGQ